MLKFSARSSLYATTCICMLSMSKFSFFFIFSKVQKIKFLSKRLLIILMYHDKDLRWGPAFCGASSGSKMFAKFRVQSSLAGKEFNLLHRKFKFRRKKTVLLWMFQNKSLKKRGVVNTVHFSCFLRDLTDYNNLLQ